MKRMLCVFVLLGATEAQAAGDLIRTNEQVWSALTESEKVFLQARYIVDVAEDGRYGMIVDAQAVDESTPGTTGGAAIGQAYGSALYVDNAFKGPRPNYSATGHISSAILGGLLGSALDAPAQRRFHFRYTVRGVSGGIKQLDQVNDQPFRQPVGMCVSIPSLAVVNDGVCDTNVAGFRARYLPGPASTRARAAATPPVEKSRKQTARTDAHQDTQMSKVRCKIGSSGIVLVSLEECKNAEGKVL